MEGEGFEPSNNEERIYSPSRLTTSLTFVKLSGLRESNSCLFRHKEIYWPLYEGGGDDKGRKQAGQDSNLR